MPTRIRSQSKGSPDNNQTNLYCYRAKFVEFCKSSPTVKRLLEAEVREGRSRSSSRSATNTPSSLRKLTNRDRAAMAFKVRGPE